MIKIEDMHKANKHNSRSAFLKKLPLALVSVFGMGITGLILQKPQRFSGNKFKMISEKEANNHIRNISSFDSKQIKPKPPPKFQ